MQLPPTRMPHEAIFQPQMEVQAAHLLSVLQSYQRELQHGPQPCEEASQPPVCLWRLFLQKLPQWTSSLQTHEDLCFGNCHPRLLQMVGLLLWTTSPVTQLRKAEPSDFHGGHLARPPLDHTDHKRLPSVEPGDIRPPRCGHYSGGRASSSYLHLLTYKQISFIVLIVLKSK